jgi:hypothetical protein
LFQLYDRLGRHAYQPRPEDKSGNDTTSESDDDRSRRQWTVRGKHAHLSTDQWPQNPRMILEKFAANTLNPPS